jgi:hypothetical protein
MPRRARHARAAAPPARSRGSIPLPSSRQERYRRLEQRRERVSGKPAAARGPEAAPAPRPLAIPCPPAGVGRTRHERRDLRARRSEGKTSARTTGAELANSRKARRRRGPGKAARKRCRTGSPVSVWLPTAPARPASRPIAPRARCLDGAQAERPWPSRALPLNTADRGSSPALGPEPEGPEPRQGPVHRRGDLEAIVAVSRIVLQMPRRASPRRPTPRPGRSVPAKSPRESRRRSRRRSAAVRRCSSVSLDQFRQPRFSRGGWPDSRFRPARLRRCPSRWNRGPFSARFGGPVDDGDHGQVHATVRPARPRAG